MEKKMTSEHDEVIHEEYVEHYEAHPARVETSLFRKTKKHMHEHPKGCWVGNGKCDGGIQIHHNEIEYSAESEIDWEKVHKDFPSLNDVDQEEQMLELCEKHHVWRGFGKHHVPEPIYKLQRYMKDEPLVDFERATYEKLYKDDDKYFWDETTQCVRRKR